MKKILIISSILLSGFITNSCVNSLDININKELRLLVVEGYITTQNKPFRIQLWRSAKYGSVFDGFQRPVERATVAVRDNTGKITFYNEIGDGVYESPNGFKAEVGKSYSLLIISDDGSNYFSRPELVTEAPPIDSLIVRYKKLPTNDPAKFTSGAEVYSRWKDPSGVKNYHLWLNNGTYKIKTFPEDHTIVVNGTTVPDPLDCCAICWASEMADYSIHTYSDINTDGNTVTSLAAFIEDDGGRFYEKYLSRIEQLSISQDAYLFFNLLGNQLSINGDIFDPPPATIRGNIVNLDNPDEQVIGYFFAADVAVDSVYIHREQLDDHQRPLKINDTCLRIRNSTTEQPEHWDEN